MEKNTINYKENLIKGVLMSSTIAPFIAGAGSTIVGVALKFNEACFATGTQTNLYAHSQLVDFNYFNIISNFDTSIIPNLFSMGAVGGSAFSFAVLVAPNLIKISKQKHLINKEKLKEQII